VGAAGALLAALTVAVAAAPAAEPGPAPLPEFAESPNRFLEAVAREAPRGEHPRYLIGQQSYWTVVGTPDDDREALLSEDGALEVDAGSFSLEPFLFTGGALVSWADVEIAQSLEAGSLPIPTVSWRRGPLGLQVTAFAAGPPESSVLYARYRLRNEGTAAARVGLLLALRPMQVLPPWQDLNMKGGFAPIRQVAFDGRRVLVNAEKAVLPLTPADRFGAAAFEEGTLGEFLRAGRVPGQREARDAQGLASAALAWDAELAPGGEREVLVAVPFRRPEDADPLLALAGRPGAAEAHVAARIEASRAQWRDLLGRVSIRLPASAAAFEETLRSSVAWNLVHRDGPVFQPGSRTYARAWIRDGAFTGTALLQMGLPEASREFLRWYAGQRLPDGGVACCVDARGPDPTPEHDGDGLFLWAVAEHLRFSGDRALARELWPRVVEVVGHVERLRAERLGDEYRTPEKRAYRGLLPESISHEGYWKRPVHSFWDDFLALRGLVDAAYLARAVGDAERADAWAALRDAFRADILASQRETMRIRGIDHLAASVELGDLDPTATAIAIAPGQETANLPEPALTRTFERYWSEWQERREGRVLRDAYAPYELRIAEAFVQLGRRERAHDILERILADRRPLAWNGWPEIVWRDPRDPRFLGEVPHGWIASTFIRAVRSLFVWERERDEALVVAAGVPLAWAQSEEGVTVERLPTRHGPLSWRLRAEGPRALRLGVGSGVTVPPGGLVLEPPLPADLLAVTVNGARLENFAPRSATIRSLPADVVFAW
jgi:hypothetical protein